MIENPFKGIHPRWIPWGVVLVILGLSLVGQTLMTQRGVTNRSSSAALPSGARSSHGIPQKIISLAPSVTEVLFALGLGERVVGVTHHCRYPPSAQSKDKVGDYYVPDYEAILFLRPDLVILLPEHGESASYLAHLGVQTLVVNHFTIGGILDSIRTIGKACGKDAAAEQMVSKIGERMNLIRSRTMNLPAPRVMVSVGRNMGSGTIKEVYICGQDTLYGELVDLAGGKNVSSGLEVKFPVVSGEGILRLNPEVILEVIPDLEESGWREEDVLSQWNLLSGVDAVAHRQVFVLSHNYAVVPGPRFICILEDMARLIHPEIDWGSF